MYANIYDCYTVISPYCFGVYTLCTVPTCSYVISNYLTNTNKESYSWIRDCGTFYECTHMCARLPPSWKCNFNLNVPLIACIYSSQRPRQSRRFTFMRVIEVMVKLLLMRFNIIHIDRVVYIKIKAYEVI